jgi:ABC-2 type transport system permease protein
MLADIWTVAWKEWREMLHAGGSVRSGWVRLLLLPVGLGIMLPLQSGRDWVTDPRMLFGYAWLPALLAITAAADSFAGERERHTLETLLASRLPDRAILWGKVLGIVGYAWGTIALLLVLGLVTVNVAYGREGLLCYEPGLAAVALGLSLLLACSATGVGVLVSLRAPTVRQAQQTLSAGLIVILLLAYSPVYALRLLPALWRERIGRLLAGASLSQLAAWAALALSILTLTLLAAAPRSFRRARLALE